MTAAFDQSPRLITASPAEANGVVAELAQGFADAIVAGDGERLDALLCDDVVYQLPGPHSSAARHTGRTEVLAALTPQPAAGVSARRAEVTEVMVDRGRGLVIVLFSGTIEAEPFAFETAFHRATDGMRLIGITEYSGNQHVADRLVDTGRPMRERRARLLQRWSRST